MLYTIKRGYVERHPRAFLELSRRCCIQSLIDLPGVSVVLFFATEAKGRHVFLLWLSLSSLSFFLL